MIRVALSALFALPAGAQVNCPAAGRPDLAQADLFARADCRAQAREAYIRLLNETEVPSEQVKIRYQWGKAVVFWCEKTCDLITREEGRSALLQVAALSGDTAVGRNAAKLAEELKPPLPPEPEKKKPGTKPDALSWIFLSGGVAGLALGGLSTYYFIDNTDAIDDGFDNSTNRDRRSLSAIGMAAGFGLGAGLLIAWLVREDPAEASVSLSGGPGFLGLTGRW